MLEEMLGWVMVIIAAGVYAGAWLFLGIYVLGSIITGWGPHDHLRLREALVPLWCALARDEEITARLAGILDRRLEAAEAGKPHRARHARTERIPAGRWFADPPDEFLPCRDDSRWLYMRRWPPYL
jgi:hypothetical protein